MPTKKKANVSTIKSRKQFEDLKRQGASFITGTPERPPKRKSTKKK